MKVWLMVLAIAGVAGAQQKQVPKAVPVPLMPKTQPRQKVAEPTSPPAQTVEDARTHVSFRLPAGWNVTHKDGEVSTFHLDARTAPKQTQLYTVASLGFNPFPYSTFSGALFYVSSTPHSTAAACASQTTTPPARALEPQVIGDVQFSRGRDEYRKICVESRDVEYTALRAGRCVRFDLAVNTFCGGEVSGVQDMTEAELGSVFKRLEGVMETVRFAKQEISGRSR